MHRVAQQRHTVAGNIDDDLQCGCDTERQQRQLHRAYPQLVVAQGRVGGQLGIAMCMPVAGQVQRGGDGFQQRMAVLMVMMMVVMLMPVIV